MIEPREAGPSLLTVREVAHRLNVSERTVLRHAEEYGAVPLPGSHLLRFRPEVITAIANGGTD